MNTSMKFQLTIIVILFIIPSSCFSQSCTVDRGLQKCSIKTSTKQGEFLQELNPNSRNLKLEIVIDSTDIPSNATNKVTRISSLVVDVVQKKKLCHVSEWSVSDADCLISEDISPVINTILRSFPNITYLKINSSTPLKFSFNRSLRFIDLEFFITNGLHLTFDQPLHLLSTNLSSLTFANAGINNLDVVDFQNCNKLVDLKLNENEIERLSSNLRISDLSRLGTLELKGNRLRRIEKDNFIKRFRHLRDLYLCQNQITFIDDEAFNGLTELDYLSLRGNKLTSVPIINSNPGVQFNLKELILRDNSITSIDKRNFLGLQKLSSLDLRSNSINKFVFSNLNNIKSLLLSDNSLSSLEIASAKLDSLKELNLDGNNLSSMPYDLISILKTSKENVTVNLSGNPWKGCHILDNWFKNFNLHHKEVTRTLDKKEYRIKIGDKNKSINITDSSNCFENRKLKNDSPRSYFFSQNHVTMLFLVSGFIVF